MKTKIHVQQITITQEPIRLGQFLKLANHVQDGLEAKILIQNEEVFVNNLIEIRRGRQLYHGDTVQIGHNSYQVSITK